MRTRALLLGLAMLAAAPAAAQHAIDPEVWIEMRKMHHQQCPTPSIAEDEAELAGTHARRAGG